MCVWTFPLLLSHFPALELTENGEHLPYICTKEAAKAQLAAILQDFVTVYCYITIPNAWPVYADVSSSNLCGCVFADSILGQDSISAHITL